MSLTQTQALLMMLFVSMLWGSWMQVVKHTGDYPVYAFLSWMYLFSLLLVWSVIAICGTKCIPEGVLREIQQELPRAVLILLCGGIYAVGMQLQLAVVERAGLLLSGSITSTCMILSGIVLSALLGGVSEKTSLPMVLVAAVLLVGGTILCQTAGAMRFNHFGENDRKEKAGIEKKDILMLIFTSAVLIPFYSIASSVGLRTELQTEGFSALTCMGLLSVGAFLGTSIYTGVHLQREKKWKLFLYPDKGMKKIAGMAAIAAVCHFGGNILQAFAAPVVSVVIAAGIGYSNGMWSYLWGLLYGEFQGASKRTYEILGAGICLYIIGVLIMTGNAGG